MTVFGRVFSFSLFYVVLYGLLLWLLISLGFWQLGRSDEKRLLLEQQTLQEKINLEFSAQTPDNVENLRFQQATTVGHYDIKRQFLIDNQIVKGKAGYFVMTPFILENSYKAILVNRGWLLANPDRNILPEINFSMTDKITLRGRINSFPSVGIKLQGAEIPTEGFPSVVQVVNSDILAEKLAYPLFSFQIELAADSPNGYHREWLRNNLMPPEKHTAYAVQWFGLAFTLSILFFWYSSKKQIDE